MSNIGHPPARPDFYLTCTCGGDDKNVDVAARIETPSGPQTRKFDGAGDVPMPLGPGESVAHVIVTPRDHGYWIAARETPAHGERIDCPPLKGPWGTAWWHEAHGIQQVDPSRGENIRIGVIDDALDRDSGLAHVKVLGQIVERWRRDANGKLEEVHDLVPVDNWRGVSHGQQVCSLLTTRYRPGQEGFEGMAPGADVFFVAARTSDADHRLRMVFLAKAIAHLVEHDCHIISISAGDHPVELPALQKQLQIARDAGCLCIFAAGNGPGQVNYPAKYPEVVSVTAFGGVGYAPPGTLARKLEQQKTPRATNAPLFAFPFNSTHGPTGCMAAGTSICNTLAGRPQVDLQGTSFSAPIAAGVLAACLSKATAFAAFKAMPPSAARADYALDCLKKICQPTGIPPQIEGLGCPKLPFNPP